MIARKYKWLRIGIISLLSFLFLILSYYKSRVVFDFSDYTFFSNPGLVKGDYPLDFSSISKALSKSDKWMYNLILSIVYALLSILLIHLIFWSKKITALAGGLFIVLGIIVIVFLYAGIIMNNKFLAYSETRFIKDYLIQSPFVVLLISAIAWKGKKANKSSL